MVFDRFPVHHQRVTLRLLDAAVQFHAMATLGAQKKRLRLSHTGFEQRFLSFADVDAGNLLNHGFVSD